MFESVVERLTLERIKLICEVYGEKKFHSGVIELCLSYAKKMDPAEYGLLYYTQQNADVTLPQQKFKKQESNIEYYQLREKAYQLIFTSLTTLNTHISSTSNITHLQTATYRKQIYETCLSSTDTLFHYKLYDYLISQNLIEDLIYIKSGHLVTYLIQNQSEIKFADLLWQLYISREEFMDAARLLLTIALSQEYHIDLNSRVVYLHRALSNSRSITRNGVIDAGLYEEIKETLDVAEVQVELLKTVRNIPELGDLMTGLNAGLINLTDVNFMNFGLIFRCIIGILKCMGYLR